MLIKKLQKNMYDKNNPSWRTMINMKVGDLVQDNYETFYPGDDSMIGTIISVNKIYLVIDFRGFKKYYYYNTYRSPGELTILEHACEKNSQI